MSQFDWPITQKNMKLWRLIEDSILKYRVPPLWPTYIGERKTTFAKAYEIKVRCYVGEHIGNLGNIVRTWWEPIGNLKGRHLECMLRPFDWLQEISLPKGVRHHFWPGLIPFAKNTLPIMQCLLQAWHHAHKYWLKIIFTDPNQPTLHFSSSKTYYGIVGLGFPHWQNE